MKKNVTQNISLAVLVRFMGKALKEFFNSGSNRDFKRLKDFISS